MLRNKLVRSDGSIIDSSVIISCEYTEEVNSSTNLSVGNVTASEIAVEIRSTDAIRQDDVVTYYIIEDDVETKIGVFNVEKPTVATRTSMKFSAYDNIAKTEKNFSPWLRENQNLFPMTLLALVQYACTYCGLTLATTDFPRTGLSVNVFYADNITCRQILNWAGSIAGRFIRANENGEVEFAWYTDASNITIRPNKIETPDTAKPAYDDGEGNVSIMAGDIEATDDGERNVSVKSENLLLLTGDEGDVHMALMSDEVEVIDDGSGNISIVTENLAVLNSGNGTTLTTYKSFPYFQGSLTYENYATDPVARVQVNHSEDDVGVIYPSEADGNCFTISENMIMGVTAPDTVSLIAADLYNLLKDVSYVPCSLTIPRTKQVRAGDIINVVDPYGNTFISYVMKVTIAASGTTLTSTGDKSYGSNAAVASEKYSNLSGKILAITKNIDGLYIENKDLAGKVGSLELTTEEFKTYVSDNYVTSDEFGSYKSEVSTQFLQTATDFEMKFTSTNSAIDGVNQDLQNKYQERVSYIKFTDGNIVLGKSDSDIMLILKNDRVSFVRNVSGNPEIAYISDDILYITEGEFLTQLRIGKFGFTPGANGNLSFKKVVS